MPFYLLLVLGWFGVALVASMLMGRFIVAGRGEPHVEEGAVASHARGDARPAEADARRGKREAA